MTYYCGRCKEQCDVHALDDGGYGYTEYWGSRSYDEGGTYIVSDCCEEIAYKDADCSIPVTYDDVYGD